MSYLVWLVPIALGMGVVGLLAFLWSIQNGQYEDLDGAAERVLLGQLDDRPIVDDKKEDRITRGESDETR